MSGPTPAPPQIPQGYDVGTFGEGKELIFNKWETGNFVLSIWTTAEGIVEDVDIRLRPSSPFRGRCGCGAVTVENLARAIQADAEMVALLEESSVPVSSVR